MSDTEIRACAVHDLRVESSRGSRATIRGTAIVFWKLSENLGGFRELIAPSAVDRTLADGIDLRALVDHDSAKIIGRMSAGTLRVEKDASGLRVEIDPPETTTGQDIVESIRRRDVQGMSFAFSVMPDGVDWDFKVDPPVRTVHDALIREVSIVVWPAFPDTTIALRCLAERQQRITGGRPRTIDERLIAQRARAASWR
jgi:HK97 family phage prohead protease